MHQIIIISSTINIIFNVFLEEVNCKYFYIVFLLGIGAVDDLGQSVMIFDEY